MASIRMDLVVTEHGGQPTPVVAGAADMIALANENKARWGIDNVDFVVSDYEAMTFDHEFDAAVFYDSLHHAVDERLALAKVYQALKPGGKVCIMEISRPRGRLLRGLLRFHISVLVPLMARLTGRHADVQKLWAYYGDTIEAALDPETIMDALRHAGFADVGCSVSLGIFREYTGVRPA